MSREVKVGDVVKLKCCAQQMVVEGIDSGENPRDALCAWIDDFGKPYKERYRLKTLDFVAEGFAEAMFKRKSAPKGEPVTIDEENLPF